MNLRTLLGYVLILGLSFFLHAAKPANNLYFSTLPLLMIIYPIAVGHRIKLNFSLKDLSLGLLISAAILLPYYLLFGGNLRSITVSYVLFQLLSVSFPEEYFFRGFLQDSIGMKFKGVLVVSVLFSLAHLPQAIFSNEWIVLLSFFPSLAMGWLYMKTGNILPGTVFHLLANLMYSVSIR
ncbi:MAG TPA: CPBP family intramembrane glutamic endopeptidase [Thermodesulfovibrionales bacterium]|nr:CPBP family intramembrane glutamic endopeptidase [Thermodesulfovibrionales bacterium]